MNLPAKITLCFLASLTILGVALALPAPANPPKDLNFVPSYYRNFYVGNWRDSTEMTPRRVIATIHYAATSTLAKILPAPNLVSVARKEKNLLILFNYLRTARVYSFP